MSLAVIELLLFKIYQEAHMENEKNQKDSKIDWFQKGRGWQPEPADLRDFRIDNRNIQTSQRLRTDQVTESIEDLLESLLQTLKSSFSSKQTESLEEFKSRFSGGIYIAKLKIYTTLRQRTKARDQQLVDKVTFDERIARSLLARQLSELKQYLNFLVLKKFLQQPSNNDLKKPFFAQFEIPDSGFNLNAPQENAAWLGSNEYDDTTRQLVMLFQLYAHIHVDGVVGYESYTTLNEYFSDVTRLNNLKDCADNYNKLAKVYEEDLKNRYPQVAQKPKIKLRTVPILLPNEFFEALFTEFQKAALSQILRESCLGLDSNSSIPKDKLLKSFTDNLGEEYADSATWIRFSSCLEQIFENCYSQHSGTYFSGDYYEEIGKEKSKLFLEKILDENKLSVSLPENVKMIKGLFSSEFYTLEPIILMVLKPISPLASYKNLSIRNIISTGFDKFVRLFPQVSDPVDLSGQHLKDSPAEKGFTANENDLENLKQQAQEAVKKVKKTIDQSIELILEDIALSQNKEEFDRVLMFYLLIKKLINFLSCSNAEPTNQSSSEPNSFDKQEFFVIQSAQDELSQQNEQMHPAKSCRELFQADELMLPVSDSFLELNYLKNLESQTTLIGSKLYFFLPGFVDLSFWCPEIRDQGPLNSCTAFAGTALFEYFVNRSSGQYDQLSPLFLYQAARQLMEVKGDTGASVRDTMKAMALFGIPPETSWPYKEATVDIEPPSFCYAYAENFKTLKYFRLDYAGISKETLLFEIKSILTAGFPCMFGFTLYSSAIKDPNPKKGFIPFPDVEKDKVVDGHAVLAVGYDDNKIVGHANPDAQPTRGAILIRNSWGLDWGNQGYGWLPYDFVLEGLTSAWWSLLKADWFKGYGFGLGGDGGTKTCCEQKTCNCQPPK